MVQFCIIFVYTYIILLLLFYDAAGFVPQNSSYYHGMYDRCRHNIIYILILLYYLKYARKPGIRFKISHNYTSVLAEYYIAIIMIPSIKYSNIIKRENNFKIYFNVNVLKRTKINIYFVILFRFLIISVGSAWAGNYW